MLIAEELLAVEGVLLDVRELEEADGVALFGEALAEGAGDPGAGEVAAGCNPADFLSVCQAELSAGSDATVHRASCGEFAL